MNTFLEFYQTPTELIRQNRRIFYSVKKLNDESMSQWLWRIREYAVGCEFGAVAEFILIDKFICELTFEDVHKIKNVNSWSLKQLEVALHDQKSINSEPNDSIEESTNPKQVLDLEDDVPFLDTNNYSSTDSEDNKIIADIKREINAEDVNKNKKLLNEKIKKKNSIAKSSPIKKGSEIEGFEIVENRLHCLDCGKKFTQKASYLQHSRLHTGKNLLSCTICNKLFLKSSHLKGHFKRHERENNLTGKTFECHLCKYQFLAINGLRVHMNVKHVTGVKNAFQCKKCNEVFVKQTNLDDHLRSEHRMKVTHKCPHCNKPFEQLSNMKEHMAVHSEAKPFMCEVCGNAFKTKKQLSLHMTRHTNERRYKCGECGLMLKSRSNYKNHMRQHTGERPFACSFPNCEKTFVQRANYLKHLRWHTGIKPHGCTYCEKRFPTAYDMKLHINSMHTGHKPFCCEICGNAFAQPSTLRVHRLRVHKQTSHN